MQLSDLIKVHDNVVAEPICNQLIKMFENKYSNDHEIHDNDLFKFHQLNLGINNELRMISEQFIKTLFPYFGNYFNDLGFEDYVGVQSFEEVRIKRYLKNTDDQFRSHVDVTNKTNCMRYLVTILYLNDNNGETYFPNLDITVTPKTGRILMFPPLWMFPHAGKPSTDKDKYIMMTSLHYA